MDLAFDFTLLLLDLGTAVLAGLCLAMEFLASPRWARRAPALLAGLLALLATVTWRLGYGGNPAVGFSLLAAFFLLAWAVRLDAVRERIKLLMTPKVLWCLVLGVSLVASRFLASHLLASVEEAAGPSAIELRDLPIADVQAVTDAGRPIGLFHFEMLTPVEKSERIVLAGGKYEHHVIRLADASDECNCHGWVFTAGRCGIRSLDVPAILADNGYVQVDAPREGDLALYTSGDTTTHSGIVRMATSAGQVLVESKWGPFGVYLHPPDLQPFSGRFAFYRSPRDGHLLGLQPLATLQD